MVRWVLGLLWMIPLQASATVLSHDTWEDGAEVTFATDHCPGDCSAVLFQPDSYPFTVDYVYVMVGPGSLEVTASVLVLDAGTSLYPDTAEVLGGADEVALQADGAAWVEVDLEELGKSATITGGRFGVAVCYLEDDDPCGSWGVGLDGGPGVVSDGGVVYLDPTENCASGVCTGASGSHAWANLAEDANWLLRVADEPWEPSQTDDDDSAGDDDTTGEADDDTSGTTEDLVVEGIEPNAIKEGDFSEFVISGTGFDPESEVYFGQLRVLPVDVTGDTSIIGAFPDGLIEGTYDVCVANPGDSSSCLAGALQVLPASGCGGCTTGPRATGAATAGLVMGLLLLALRRGTRH